RASGLRAIAEGKVALVLMAGRQGTRLGSSAPKGTYDIELSSHKSLFQLQAERIIRLTQLAGKEAGSNAVAVLLNAVVSIPWFVTSSVVMTSEPTHQPTIDCFQKHNFFGLSLTM
ncbi:hypothetical protein V8E36_005182, partial [Tilletia maclaganii]